MGSVRLVLVALALWAQALAGGGNPGLTLFFNLNPVGVDVPLRRAQALGLNLYARTPFPHPHGGNYTLYVLLVEETGRKELLLEEPLPPGVEVRRYLPLPPLRDGVWRGLAFLTLSPLPPQVLQGLLASEGLPSFPTLAQAQAFLRLASDGHPILPGQGALGVCLPPDGAPTVNGFPLLGFREVRPGGVFLLTFLPQGGYTLGLGQARHAVNVDERGALVCP